MGWRVDDALRAITLTPAESWASQPCPGRCRRAGTQHCRAWSGDPFEFATRVEHVLIRGREVAQPSRQDELMALSDVSATAYRKP